MQNNCISCVAGKRGFIKLVLIVTAIALTLTFAGQYAVLAIARQPKHEGGYAYSDSFYTT